MWRDIQKVHRATEELMELGGYEGNWRDMVVNPLLGLAIEHFGLEDQMTVSNVYATIARFQKGGNVSMADDRNSDMVRIDPDDLRPCDPMDDNKKVQIKKIDTIVALELPRDRVDNAFAKWPAASRSFIQSTMNLHCRSPIILNIEVKAANGIDPLGQFGIWSAAGFQKRSIDGDEREGVPRMPMPGLAIVGHRWELHVAYKHSNGRVVSLFFPLWIAYSFVSC